VEREVQKTVFFEIEDQPKLTRGNRLAVIIGLATASWLGIIGVVSNFF